MKSGGKMYRCAICLITRYCSYECQKFDWKQHQKFCKKIDKDDPQVKLSNLNVDILLLYITYSLISYKKDNLSLKELIFCKLIIRKDEFFDYIKGKNNIFDNQSVEMTFTNKDEFIKITRLLNINETCYSRHQWRILQI
jgi:hypothetical protein